MKRLLLAGAAFLGLVLSGSAARATPFDFTYTGSLVAFAIPTTDAYQILAFGAQGGNSVSFPNGTVGIGGHGAEIGGDFLLSAGEILEIAVGGDGGGGGGGSFVVGPGDTPLIIAGGGGAGDIAGITGIPGGEALLVRTVAASLAVPMATAVAALPSVVVAAVVDFSALVALVSPPGPPAVVGFQTSPAAESSVAVAVAPAVAAATAAVAAGFAAPSVLVPGAGAAPSTREQTRSSSPISRAATEKS
jgi:hypothetical protein